MAGTAGVPTSLVEMTISCRSLRDTDVFSKSDPVCIIMHRPFGANKWAEYKRTECISNTLNPDFATKILITYNFEVQQHLKFCVYDIDSKNPNLDNHDFLGEFETTLGQLVSSRVLERPLIDKNCSYISCGNIRIITEELSSCREELILQLNGREFENKKWFGSISPFLEFSKANEDGTFTLVHRTEQARKTSTPVWKEFSVPLRSFCSGDYDRNLKVNAKDFVSSGNHKLFGTFHTTVRKLSEGGENTYHVINEEKQKRKGSSYKYSGIVSVNKAHIRQIYTFLDYIKGGTEINAFIAIDFTASNGNPQDSQSLHYINPHAPNQYVRAIQSVADIIEDYDSDKYFPVLGFGARQPPDYTQVSHEFFVNGNPTSPFCYRVQGVIDAYYNCLHRVQLYGPTNFAPIINHVARFAANHRGGDKYFILLMITDGIITDMPMTKEAIVNASNLPLSIIIVGVGNADFNAMEELDGDVIRLSSNGKYAERDIVQFVPFRNFLQGTGDPGSARLRLAKEVLAEVPDQLLSYMKVNNIPPQPSKVQAGVLPPDPTMAAY
ncbi:UNVERIFIED_CONTAM: hypothetical protein RMT77_009584 [Armadillidium vulgare]